MKGNRLFKCEWIVIFTIIVVITATLIGKKEHYYIRRVNLSTTEYKLINAVGIDDLFLLEFRIKSPNGLPVKQELFFRRYIDGKLKEEEAFNVNGVVYPNMKLKFDEGKVLFTKFDFEKELGFELYHFFSEKEWAKGVTKIKNIELPFKGNALAIIDWKFDEYKNIRLDNEYILRITMYDHGIIPLERKILEEASKGDNESLEIILKRYPIVEVLKIKISSMDN